MLVCLLLFLTASTPLRTAAEIRGDLAGSPQRDSTQLEGRLPVSKYEELRRLAMAHAGGISGPRLKNPRMSFGGIDREVAMIIAEERSYRKSHNLLNPIGTGMLSSSAGATLLPAVHTGSILQTPPRAISQGKYPTARPHCGGPQIRFVNGIVAGAVFTPAQPDNHYRIEGCAFGSTPGSIILRPSSQLISNADSIQLMLDSPASWTDGTIDVHLDPGLKGISDSQVDLIVRLSDGRSVQLSGCIFVAVRGEPQLLKTIPAGWVTMDPSSSASRAIRQLEYESPPAAGSEVPPQAAAASAYIARSDTESFESGKDNFDFSDLAPGWSVESVQLTAFTPSCPGQDTTQQASGIWSTTWTPRGFNISWTAQSCTALIPPVYSFALHSSQYAASVWVTGPAGTQALRATSNVRLQ